MLLERSFPAEKASVARARHFVSDALASCATGIVDVAVLLTSEVVSNAVLHSNATPVVSVDLDGERIRVEVADASPALPVRKRYGLQATTGRGLLLLDTLARAWGADPTGSGKRVWFEVDLVAVEDEDDDEHEPQLVADEPDAFDDAALAALARSLGEEDAEGDGGPVARHRHRRARPARRTRCGVRARR